MKKEERAKQITSPSNDKILHLAKKLPAKGVGGRAGGRRREDEEEDKFPYSKTLSTWIEQRSSRCPRKSIARVVCHESWEGQHPK